MIELTKPDDDLSPCDVTYVDGTTAEKLREENIAYMAERLPIPIKSSARGREEFVGASPREAIFLESLWVDLDAGISWTTLYQLEKRGHELENASDPRVRTYLADVIAKHLQLLEIEKAHGFGAPLQLDHPVVKSLIRSKRADGTPLVSPRVVERARAFQARHRAS